MGKREHLLPRDRASNDASEELEVHGTVACCVACGTTDAASFSARMLNKRGRHGERCRRCRTCVAAQEELEQRQAHERRSTAVQLASGGDADGSLAVDPATQETAQESVLEKRRKKVLKALRQIEELRAKQAAGLALEATQHEKMARQSDLQAELQLILREAERAQRQSFSPASVVPPMSGKLQCDSPAREGTTMVETRPVGTACKPIPAIDDDVHLSTNSAVVPRALSEKRREKRAAGWARKFRAADGASPKERGVIAISFTQLPITLPDAGGQQEHGPPPHGVGPTPRVEVELEVQQNSKKKRRVLVEEEAEDA